MSKITKETGKTLASEIIKDLEKEARNKDLAIIALLTTVLAMGLLGKGKNENLLRGACSVRGFWSGNRVLYSMLGCD